uniref:Uncharacterized protein n=1 Tax=Rhizophora mucronata TaxID=61149 RepID=A0A2P2R4Q3_RHIMU
MSIIYLQEAQLNEEVRAYYKDN